MSMCNHMARMNPQLIGALNGRAAEEGLPPMPTWSGDAHRFFADWLDGASHIMHVGTFWNLRDRSNLLLVHYNDLKADLSREMRRIADFLDIAVPETLWSKAVDRCTFESMREQEQQVGTFDAFEGGIKGFIFKGTNGRWRDVLSAEELSAYERRVAELLPPAAAAWMAEGRAKLGAVANP
jgi:aryl sulfotransferase